MKKGPLLVAASAAGLAGVVVAHTTHGSSHGLASGLPAPGGTTPSTTNTPTTSPGHDNPPPSPTTTTPPAPTAAGSAVGTTENYGYGQLAVKVTVAGGKITAITVPVLQTAEPYSQQLAAQVIPMLRGEVLTAQSAQINGVSGATYTSEAYAYSLQAALDSLHFK